MSSFTDVGACVPSAADASVITINPLAASGIHEDMVPAKD
jgi:hypothetical protein